MSLVSIRLPDALETRLADEAERTGRPKSEIAREAIVDYLERLERERFLAAIARASSARDNDEAITTAEEALPFDNEALALVVPPGVHERGAPYGGKRPRKKTKRR